MSSIQEKIEIYKTIKDELIAASPFEIDGQHQKEERIISSIAAFKATDFTGTNKELSEITGISSSSIQRYLNDEKMVIYLTNPETYTLIRDSIIKNKLDAKIRGGINSTKKSVIEKDAQGKFVGRLPYDGYVDKEAKKKDDIMLLVGIYLSSDTSLEKMAAETGLTRDYIYDCLTSKHIKDIINIETYEAVRKKLEAKKPVNISTKKR